MRALRVRLNNNAPVVAGANDLSHLAFEIRMDGKLGPDSVMGSRPTALCALIGVTGRGNFSEEQALTWLVPQELDVGDSVTIEIVETDDPTPACHQSSPGRSIG